MITYISETGAKRACDLLVDVIVKPKILRKLIDPDFRYFLSEVTLILGGNLDLTQEQNGGKARSLLGQNNDKAKITLN